MSETDYTETAESLQTELADEDVDVDLETLERGIEEGVETYSLDLEEAARTVANRYTPDDSSVSVPQVGDSDNEHIAIEEIPTKHAEASRESAWVDATVEVLSTWTIDADSVAQKAQIADSTGKAQLTVWASAGAPTLSEGDVVALGNVPADEYQGTYSLKVTSDSTVEFREEDIDAVDNNEHINGRIVQVDEGLVDRCAHEDCTRVVDSDCPEHPGADTNEDLRLKLTVDDGREAYDVVLQQAEAEEVLGVTFEEAMEHLNDTLDKGDTNDELQEGIAGQRIAVSGPEIYNAIQAEEVVVAEGDALADLDVNEMLVEAREARPAAVNE